MAIFKRSPNGGRAPHFGLTGGWLTFWVSVACATDMTLFGYDQGVFGAVSVPNRNVKSLLTNQAASLSPRISSTL